MNSKTGLVPANYLQVIEPLAPTEDVTEAKLDGQQSVSSLKKKKIQIMPPLVQAIYLSKRMNGMRKLIVRKSSLTTSMMKQGVFVQIGGYVCV